jgi:hypothetical protein
MGREEAREKFAAAVDRVALPPLSDIARFAQALTTPAAVARQYFSFWRGPIDDARAQRIVDFLMFDLRVEGFGRRAVDQFALERGAQLDEEARGLLDAWSASPYRLYVVERWSGGFVHCADALTPERGGIEVLPLRGGGPLSEGKPIALRALACAGGYFSTGSPTQFGDRSAAEVAAAIKGRHLDYVRRQRIIGIDEFLKVQPTALDEEAALGAPASIIIPGRPR